MCAGHKIHMPGNAQLGGLQSPQVVDADRLDLLAVGALLIEFKQFLRFPAAGSYVNGVIRHQVLHR